MKRKNGKVLQTDKEGVPQPLWHRLCSFGRIDIWKLIILSCKYCCCLNFIDINECVTKEHNCHKDASCANIKGSWNCFCNHGYDGNGTHCEGMNLWIFDFFLFWFVFCFVFVFFDLQNSPLLLLLLLQKLVLCLPFISWIKSILIFNYFILEKILKISF